MKVVWTAHMVQTLEKLVLENVPYIEIAKLMTAKFGVPFTKSSCIGKGQRLGLPPRISTMASGNGPIMPRLPRVKRGDPVTMEQLSYGRCKWPLGKVTDRPPYLYCGKPAASEGGSWCSEHSKKVFTKSIYGSASYSRR